MQLSEEDIKTHFPIFTRHFSRGSLFLSNVPTSALIKNNIISKSISRNYKNGSLCFMFKIITHYLVALNLLFVAVHLYLYLAYILI